MRVLRRIVVFAVLFALSAGSAHAATLRPIGNFNEPIYVTSDPSNPDRLFVVERAGRIELVRDGAVSLFADLSPVVESAAAERGLLSIALAPDFDTTGRFYVDYTGKEVPGEIHVAEMRAVGGGASLSTLRNVLTIPHPGETNHNGGQLQFGPDGYLYIATGDGGGGNDLHQNAQNLESLLGKILRIDPRQSGLLPYTVPPGNPFPSAVAPANTIWSYGLRNPFRFSFDRLSGAIAIGDVGQEKREEIDYAPAPGLGAGANYGWSCREGLEVGPPGDPRCATPPTGGFVDPIFDYPHLDPAGGPTRCAIIGGYVARDPSLESLYGRYLYGDLCVGEIRSLDPSVPFASDRGEGIQVSNLNSFGEDSCGRLYVVSGAGAVSRIVGSSSASCTTTTIDSNRRPTFIGLRAARRRVERHRKVQVTVWVSPCQDRKGDRVRLLRGRSPIGSKRLNVACTAQFLPRIGRPASFRAEIAADATYETATSRRLRIKIQRHHRRAR